MLTTCWRWKWSSLVRNVHSASEARTAASNGGVTLHSLVPGLDGMTVWTKLLNEAKSWDDIMGVAGGSFVGKRKSSVLPVRSRFNQFEKQLKTRLWDVERSNGLSPTKLLDSFRTSNEYRNNWVGVRCAVDFGLRLLETEHAAVDWVSEFLYRLSILPIAAKVGPRELVPFVKFLAARTDSACPTHSIRGLYGASGLRGCELAAVSLMAKVEDRCIDRLNGLSARDLELLSVATFRSSGMCYCNWMLYLKLLDEFARRLAEFLPEQCLNLMCAFVRNRPPLPGVRDKLAAVYRQSEAQLREAMRRAESNVRNACLAAARICYKADVIPFKEILLKQMESISPPTLVTLLYYITFFGVVDGELIDALLKFIPGQMNSWSSEDLDWFVRILIENSARGVHGADELVNCIKELSENKVQATSFDKSPSIKDSVEARSQRFFPPHLDDSSTSRAGCGSVIKGLYVIAQKQNRSEVLRCLSCCEGRLERSVVEQLLKPGILARCCEVMLSLRWVQAGWTNPVLDLLADGLLQRKLCTRRDSVHLQKVCITLSLLNVGHSVFFEAVSAWTLETFTSTPVPIRDVWVDFLWALELQHALPVVLARQLCKVETAAVKRLSIKSCIRLYELAVVSQSEHGVQMPIDTLDVLCCKVGDYMATRLSDAQFCIQHTLQLLPGPLVRVNAFTKDWCAADCMLLTGSDRETVTWPSDTPEQLSQSDIETFKASGLRPVAVLFLGQEWYSHDISRKLGAAVMRTRALEVHGWTVLPVSTTLLEAAEDKSDYLRRCFASAGVDV